MLTVEQAIRDRKSCRSFTDRNVDVGLIKQILEQAARAPSNGNLQPWQVYVVSGDSLLQLKELTRSQIAANEPMDEPEYAVYPKPLKPVYDARRQEIGEDIYRVLGIAREDKQGRRGQFAKNGQLFDAPVGLFTYVDRSLSYGQWMDAGMFLQSVMLLCESHGLATCAQGYWTFFHSNVRRVTNAPDDLILACGMAVGYEDTAAPINSVRASRANLSEYAHFCD
jgi:nitroreductase